MLYTPLSRNAPPNPVNGPGTPGPAIGPIPRSEWMIAEQLASTAAVMASGNTYPEQLAVVQLPLLFTTGAGTRLRLGALRSMASCPGSAIYDSSRKPVMTRSGTRGSSSGSTSGGVLSNSAKAASSIAVTVKAAVLSVKTGALSHAPP